MSRFKKFNEMLFESYCKKSVSNAAKKERQKKAARGLMEQSLSELTDAALYAWGGVLFPPLSDGAKLLTT